MKAAGSTTFFVSSHAEGAAHKKQHSGILTVSVSLVTAPTAAGCQMLSSFSPSTYTSPGWQPIIRTVKAFERKMPREDGPECKTTGGKFILPSNAYKPMQGDEPQPQEQSWLGSLNFAELLFPSRFTALRCYLSQLISLLFLEHPISILWKEHWRKARIPNTWESHRNI